MVSANDPIETIFNPIQVVKDALLPIELGVKKAARDFESCWVSKGKDFRLGRHRKKRVCASPESEDNVNSVQKKGLSVKIPVKSLFGMFSPNLANVKLSRGNEVVKKKKKDKFLEKEDDDGSCTNCFKLAMTWSLLVSGFAHAFPIPFKKRVHKMGDDKNLRSKAKSLVKEGHPFSIECAMGFVIEMLAQNLHKLDQFVQDTSKNESYVLKSALAGGLASALSTSLMHPIDTIKTRVQASTLSFPEVIAKLPEIGVRGVYKGSIPAILGQFSSHGLRTGIFEASKLVLINFAPNLPEIQVQSIASFCSTLLGTAVRIPCEVLKQRLQAGMFNNVGEAIVGTWKQDGPGGFFRGTGATLCREVPLYVVGMGLYAESKKMVAQALGRELEAWETIAVGAVSGGIAAVVTTPFDVMKTRMMTATPGRPISMSMVAISILRHEGPLGLFKGAVPRFFWVAPLGAMNFAGYELAKKAMQKNEEVVMADQLGQKKLC
ncbi:hypothetical protein F2Q70_00008398 [Brassica cretica]|uniref:Uncharacterized protein n=1 Tax=Brassica cretica TaxID=69181 RepID=A0A8S9LYC4_BRACR|nr:hypothetical protein F2Q70_00008398 [Brassica cretica]